jgi:hypothetical protein
MTGLLIGGKILLDGIRAPARLWKGQLIQTASEYSTAELNEAISL